MEKVRPDCKLGQLSLEQQRTTFAHCDRVSLAEGVQWVKRQYDLQVSNSALSAWLRRHRPSRPVAGPLQRLGDNRDLATFVGNVIGTATEITDQNIVSFAQAVFEEFQKTAEERNERRLVQFMTLALKAKDQEIRARSVDLAQDRFHFDAAKQALAFASELQRIHDSGADDRAKIEEAMTILFGKPVTVDP